MGRPNVRKAPGWSQLRKIDTGALKGNGLTQPKCTRSSNLTWRGTTHPTKQCHKGENGKWAARTCTRHLGDHNLEKLIRAPSNETTRPEHARSGDLPWRETAHPTERFHKGENDKWVT